MSLSLNEPSKHEHGFTLVEVIVVAVIVAILATVASLLYRGYVLEAQQDTVNEIAQTAAAAANTYFRKTGLDPVQTDPELEQQLKLFLPDAARFEVTRAGDVIEVRDTRYDVAGTATYK